MQGGILMPNNSTFSHLQLSIVSSGKPKLRGYAPLSTKTNENRINRVCHGEYIKHRTNELSRFWKNRRTERIANEMPTIETGIPILLEIDPSANISFLNGLGFEVVCELDEGFIIVATEDIDFSVLNRKTDDFIANVSQKCNTPARVYALCEDGDRLKRILSKDLYEKWTTISEDMTYIIDIGVSCCGTVDFPQKPVQNPGEDDDHYNRRCTKWKERYDAAYRAWDELKMERESSIETLVSAYNGEIVELVDNEKGISDVPDSFSARLKISGKCLRDLVMNFAYIFEVAEADTIVMESTFSNDEAVFENLRIESPDDNAPIICVIDSGVQEEHKYLEPAIIHDDSKSFLIDDEGIADKVNNGGHGTRVAGAILYPRQIPNEGDYKLPCWIRNMRVLDENNSMPAEHSYPPKIISDSVKKYYIESEPKTRIFNHSIGSSKSCEMKHMTAWAAEIDNQSYNNDVLFIQAAGNVQPDIITAYWKAGYPYPKYLERALCRISDPAQSLQAITVGSVSVSDFETEDEIALGKKGEVSSFSRSGPGIWDVLKPEVVEYGGTHAYMKGSDPPRFVTPPEVCPNLIRKSPEGPAFACDDIGTSFSTPKVTYIASQLEKLFPNSPALLYRALIAQSARWNDNIDGADAEKSVFNLRHIGYGFPDVERATHNNDYRVTLITPSLMEIGNAEAHIFKISIPEELSNVGEEYNILVEITLSYAASPRRTRRSVKGYLSTWLDWCCSRMGEDAETFAARILKTGSIIADDGDFNWVLGDATNRGAADGFSRKNGTLQKDWCVIKSNQLSDAFCIAVRGHKGWGEMFKAKYSLAVSFEAIDQDVPIYEPIRAEVEAQVETREIEIEI